MRVRYWAAARDRAGCAEEELPAATVAAALAEIDRRHAMRSLLDRSVLLLDGVRITADDGGELTGGSVLEVLPPFAGGAR